MSKGWTKERRRAQSEAIRNWQPWRHSTGPKSLGGKAKVSRNGWKGGKRPMFRDLMQTLKLSLKALTLYEQYQD